MTRQSDFGELSRAAMETRDEALGALRGWPAGEPVALLHSGRFHPVWARRSLLARPRAWYRFTSERRSEVISDFRFPISDWTDNLWMDLRRLLNEPGLPGSWIGYFSYDVGRLIEPSKLRAAGGGDWPLVELGWCPEIQEFPIFNFQFSICNPPEIENCKLQIANCTSDFTRDEYESAVRRALEYIRAGDVYQVNLSQRFESGCRGDPRGLYERLAGISPAWFGAYLELPGGRAILSNSPELFLRLENGKVTTRPIKGTLPASRAASELAGSEKDRAELNMIVDLMRNDLGRVCAYGTVRVAEGRVIETHPTVHHGVATIEGRLHESKDVVDLLKATLPGGSVTGAPKVRAMQVIDELEPGSRGPVYGAIGVISKDSMQLNLAIRTMLLTRNEKGEEYIFCEAPGGPLPEKCTPPLFRSYRVEFRVGGGIVADSEPAAEYEETLTKARAMLAALNHAP